MSSNRFAPSFGRLALRLALLSSTIVAGAAVPIAAQAQTAPRSTAQARAGEVQFNVPRQSLDSALTSVADQGGVRIFFTSAELSGLRSNGVTGSMTVEQALSQALTGTGFGWRYREVGTVVIEKLPETQSAIQLGPVRVEGVSSNSPSSYGVTSAQYNDPSPLHLRTAVRSGALGDRSQLDTPFSSTVITSQEIEDRQIKQIGDLFTTDASVVAQGATYATRSNLLSVRGLQLDYANGYKINGLPIINYGVELPYEDFEQIELLKGISGFMYGFGSPGGTLNYVTKKPPVTGNIASADLGFSSNAVWTEHLDLGGRVGDTGVLGYRLNATHEQGETFTGGSIKRNSVSIGLDAHITPTLTWTLDGLYQRRRATGQVASFQTFNYADKELPVPISGGRNLTSSDESAQRATFKFFSTGLEQTIGGNWTLSANYSYADTDRRYTEDFINLTNKGGDFSESIYDQANEYTFNQAQIMAQGKFLTGPVSHEVVVGGQWQKQVIHANNNSLFAPIGTGNIFLNNDIIYESDITPQMYRADGYTQSSGFASDTATIGAWSLLGGVRYIAYDQTSKAPDGSVLRKYGKDVLTPTVALMYKPRSDTTLYASYVEALEQGAIVADIYNNRGELLKPLISTQYEAGLKSDLGAVSLTAAIFRIERGAAYADADNNYVQNGLVRYQGVELGSLARLEGGWTLGANLMVLDPKYLRTNSTRDGNLVAATSRFVGTFQIIKDVAQAPGLSLSADGKYVGRSYNDSAEVLRVSDYFLLNAGVNYLIPIGTHQITIRARVENVTGHKYWYSLGESALFAGAPRTVSLSAKVSF